MSPRRSAPSSADLHRAWLELVDTDGPFLSVPVLKRAWPTGMLPPGSGELDAFRDARPAFEKAWDAWDTDRDDANALERYREARDSWAEMVLRKLLAWKDLYVAPAAADIKVHSPDYSVTVTPTGALVRGEVTGALVLIVDPVDSLRDPAGDGWAASPVDRMEMLLRASGVPIGLVTDGRWWAIVSARPETMVASGIVDAQTWTEAPAARNAFVQLLRLPRLVGRLREDLLTDLFGQSVAAAEEITEALGTQVRRAVELLVQAMSEAAIDARRRGEPDPLPADRDQVYQAAVTVMMRVVFLLFAEERGLLPHGRLFTSGYGISDELDILDARAREESSEALDATHLTWHRLLATSQALYRGASFEDIRLPSYGGSLFDPARFAFLTIREAHGTLAITVSDRVMVEVLAAVQMARLRGEPARRISFRDIDVEQIGYIYEGLLGYSCQDVGEITVGLIGKEGEEPEIPLATLEDLRASRRTDDALAGAILAWVKEDQPAASAPTKAALARAIREGSQVEDADRALRAVAPADPELRDRLRPFVSIIRRDLRNRPTVMVPGGMLVVETPSRQTAGAHYTPKSLATEVVQHALEPLAYDPGPHQRQDGWAPVDSDRILELKVADIACGSGAFLVAAARYLAGRLVEAWQREEAVTGMAPRELETRAIRTVIATCLYGADINAMAVEMCKLSLWLVSLDPRLPFSFVDDKILHGNSLLGLTDVRQLKRQHIDPSAANAQQSLYEADVDGVLRQARQLRQRLASEVDDSDPQRSTNTKRRQWRRYLQITAELTEVADAVIATGLKLGGKPSRALNVAYENLGIALGNAYPTDGSVPSRTMLDDILKAGLTPTVTTDYERWKPLHWILAVPDVMERGGFDAIIGNPPFLGGKKLTGAMGTNVRDWLINVLANGKHGHADLVAYFFLRAMLLLNRRGDIGLIATNTIAQGDTREVGLKQMVRAGFAITRAIQSRSWPAATVNLEFAAVWGTRAKIAESVPRLADEIPAEEISTLLEPGEDIDPSRLIENARLAFIGCYVLGAGFILDSTEGEAWIRADPTNADVILAYLNGEDLNSNPDTSPGRMVIDFTGLAQEDAQRYSLPYRRLVERVEPERAKKAKAVREAPWWLFFRARPAMRKAIAKLDEVLVMTRHSVAVMPCRVSTDEIFSDALVVFATSSFSDQAVLSSSPHQMWAIRYGSSLGTSTTRYTPSDVFDTFPRPIPTKRLPEIGQILDTQRREIMRRRYLGLTKLYNLVNDPDVTDAADADVGQIREIHVELDKAVIDAYGWGDVQLNHGFYTYRKVQRWTVSPAARVKIFDRLLAENLRRMEAQGEAPAPAEDEDEGEEE
jgi:hypothetical protein